jgi:signal transduction histidine kinase
MDEFKRAKRFRFLIRTFGVPLALILMLFAANSFALRHFVTHSGELVLASFKRQNIRELTSGDILSASSRIYSSLEASDWKCLKITRDTKVMIDETRGAGSCQEGFFDSFLEINLADRGGIVVSVLFTAPPTYRQALWVITLIQILILVGYTHVVSKLQQRTLRQGFELESAKLREQAALARTTQILAHDVRKPLQLVKATTATLKDARPDEVAEILRAAAPEIDHALMSVSGMIEDVLLFDDRSTLKLERIRLADLVAPLVRRLAQSHQKPRSHIELDASLSVHIVTVDKRRFERVVSNILDNALSAIQDTGRIWIRCTQKDGTTSLTIGNSDSFIPPERMDRVFDEFYTSNKAGGTGLGLAIAKRIVHAHGGTISCTSEVNDTFPKGVVEFVIVL